MDGVFDPLDIAIYETVHEFRDPKTGKRGALGLAPVIGMQSSTLSNKANPTQEFAHLTVREARSVMLASGDHRILHQLAADLGEACVPLPTLPFPADMDLLKAWAEWQRDVAETVQALRDALESHGGKIVASDIANVRRELIEDFEQGLALCDVLKGMQEPERS